MLKPIYIYIYIYIILSLGILLSPFQKVLAQSSLFEKIEIGASANYSALHYDSDDNTINDMISYNLGFQIHVLINHQLTNKLVLQTGLEYFFFTYEIEDQKIPETDFNGALTGNYFKYFMEESFNTSYLTLPMRIQYHPFSTQKIYFTAGPEFSYKIGYSNGMTKTILKSEDGKQLYEFPSHVYDVPEEANDFLVSGIAGVGYNLNTVIPLIIELKVKHSITPYLSGDNYITSWLRSVSFTVSYRL